MGFGQEIKDFLTAYKQGEAIETARTDREYKKALQDALVKKTARENDPDTLAQADETTSTGPVNPCRIDRCEAGALCISRGTTSGETRFFPSA